MSPEIEFFGIFCMTVVVIVALGSGSNGGSGTANKALDTLKAFITKKY